jgi:hypothetical protein
VDTERISRIRKIFEITENIIMIYKQKITTRIRISIHDSFVVWQVVESEIDEGIRNYRLPDDGPYLIVRAERYFSMDTRATIIENEKEWLL